MQSRLPLGSTEDEKNFYLKELKKISEYEMENKEFLSITEQIQLFLMKPIL
jgi:hypothetical protein